MSQSVLDTDVLAQICADTRQETARRRATIGMEKIRAKAIAAAPPRGFGQALMRATDSGYGLIGEIKRHSPSGGSIRPDCDPPALARAYQRGGAAALSVLTEGPHFHGSPDDLRAARAACALPVLRKDFILEPWQVYESRVMGADCILLIMKTLGDEEAVELEEIARGLDMDVLAEVHNRPELDRALGLQTKLIGINNRDLSTLRTDLNVTFDLSSEVPPDRFVIAESGIRTHADVQALEATSIRCFLVGEALMRQTDVEAATRALLGTA
jgi:indole-3-glycerol phosphate synthase